MGGHRDEIRLPLDEFLTILRTVSKVYENAHLLADEGVVDFGTLDLRPALRILSAYIEERTR